MPSEAACGMVWTAESLPGPKYAPSAYFEAEAELHARAHAEALGDAVGLEHATRLVDEIAE
jgi:hypothetical protein